MNKRNKGQKDLRKDAKAFEGAKPAKAFDGAKPADRLQQWVKAAKAVKECAIVTAEAVRDCTRLIAEAEKIQASAADARRVNHAVSMETATPLHSDIGDAVVAARVAEVKLASEISLNTARGSASLIASAVAVVTEATINREVTSTLSAIVTQELKAALRRKKLMHDATEARLEREVVKARKGGDEG